MTDPTQISIERQVALKGGVEIAVAAIHADIRIRGKRPDSALLVTELAEHFYGWLQQTSGGGELNNPFPSRNTPSSETSEEAVLSESTPSSDQGGGGTPNAGEAPAPSHPHVYKRGPKGELRCGVCDEPAPHRARKEKVSG